jgi:hypothetical protein
MLTLSAVEPLKPLNSTNSLQIGRLSGAISFGPPSQIHLGTTASFFIIGGDDFAAGKSPSSFSALAL